MTQAASVDVSPTGVPVELPNSSLRTEMYAADVPAVYRRFAEVVGDRHWKHRVSQIKAAIKSNRFMENYLREENAIAFALDQCGAVLDRFGFIPNDLPDRDALYPAVAFAGQVLSMMDMAQPAAAKQLCQRVQGAMKNPDDMRGYRLELSTATHLARCGHKLQWPELTGVGTFDLLVTDLAPNGLEVECKSISADKGRRIHRQEALAFHSLVFVELKPILRTLRSGLAVVLTVPERLPKQHAERMALARRIKQQINLAKDATLEEGATIRIVDFDSSQLASGPDAFNVETALPVIEQVTGTRNRESMLLASSAGGAIAPVVQSMLDDELMDATMATLSDAAKRQLTGTRPGLLIVGFDGINGDQLWAVAARDKDPNEQVTALTVKASKFLSATHRDFVIGVGFISKGAVTPTYDGAMDTSSTAYMFAKRQSPFWHDSLEELFRWRSSTTHAL